MGPRGVYAPDWSADYLHREAELLLKKLAERDGLDYASLPAAEQAKYQVLLREEVRKNTSTKRRASSRTRRCVLRSPTSWVPTTRALPRRQFA